MKVMNCGSASEINTLEEIKNRRKNEIIKKTNLTDKHKGLYSKIPSTIPGKISLHILCTGSENIYCVIVAVRHMAS